jgi:hypothetical protein
VFGSKKKLIIAARWYFDDKQMFSNYYQCSLCKERISRARRCNDKYISNCKETGIVPDKKMLQKYVKACKRQTAVSIQCICGGNKKCKICHGDNFFKSACPRSIVIQPFIKRIIPYFFDYVKSGCNRFPCGSRYNAPKILIEAFDEVLLAVYNEELSKTIPKE